MLDECGEIAERRVNSMLTSETQDLSGFCGFLRYPFFDKYPFLAKYAHFFGNQRFSESSYLRKKWQ